jgi:hypothetical protein
MRSKLALVPFSALEEIWHDLPLNEAGCSGATEAEGGSAPSSKRSRLELGTSSSKLLGSQQPCHSSLPQVLLAAATADVPTTTPHAAPHMTCAERRQGAAGQISGHASRSSSGQSAEAPAQKRPQGQTLQTRRRPTAAVAGADADVDACGAPVGTFWASVSRGWRRRRAAVGTLCVPLSGRGVHQVFISSAHQMLCWQHTYRGPGPQSTPPKARAAHASAASRLPTLLPHAPSSAHPPLPLPRARRPPSCERSQHPVPARQVYHVRGQ